MSDEPPAERVSRFHEHTNTNSSIRPPPSELCKDVGIDGLLDKFSDENEATPAVRRASHPRRIMEPTGARKATGAAREAAAATAATAGEGAFGRFSRVFATVFGGVLGKRKAGHDSDMAPAPAQAALDARKQAAEEAYHLAKSQGLLPAPKVFVRPAMAPRAWSADSPPTAATPRPRPPLTPRTPGSVARSPSKKDLTKQRRLSKRVSSLELKLASAKKELQSVLANDCFPPVPALPAPLHPDASSPAPTPHPYTPLQKPLPPHTTATDSAHDPDTQPPKRARLKRTSSRLHRRVSRSSVRDQAESPAVVVKPGGPVPPVPPVPVGVEGIKASVVADDGYGGLEHEMF